jgi:hypothetical protein
LEPGRRRPAPFPWGARMSELEPRSEQVSAASAHRSPSIGAFGVSVIREPVVWILALAGFFDGISGSPIHGLILGLAAVALTYDSARIRTLGIDPSSEEAWGSRPTKAASETQRRWLGIVFAICVVAYAAVAGGFARYSWPATLAVVVPIIAVLIVAWRGPLPSVPTPMRPRPVGSLLWAAVFIALGLWELTMLLLQPTLTTDSYAHPTISTLMDPVLASHPGRTIAMCLWAAVGWFLVGR